MSNSKQNLSGSSVQPNDTIYLCNFRVSVDGEWLCLKVRRGPQAILVKIEKKNTNQIICTGVIQKY